MARKQTEFKSCIINRYIIKLFISSMILIGKLFISSMIEIGKLFISIMTQFVQLFISSMLQIVKLFIISIKKDCQNIYHQQHKMDCQNIYHLWHRYDSEWQNVFHQYDTYYQNIDLKPHLIISGTWEAPTWSTVWTSHPFLGSGPIWQAWGSRELLHWAVHWFVPLLWEP